MALVATRLTHRFAGRPALSDVSFHVAPGECVALLGANGAGKTTLLLRLAGILPGTPGQIRVAGLDPAVPADRKQLPTRLGIVFQNPDDQLFSPTLRDDVAFGPLNLGIPPHEAADIADAALARVGLAGFGDREPSRLSGGEKRRAALATVLAMNPGILVLDEPTAFLDPRGRRDLANLLRDLPGTKLLATHDVELAQALAARVLVLDAGQLVADESAVLLLHDRARLAALGLAFPLSPA